MARRWTLGLHFRWRDTLHCIDEALSVRLQASFLTISKFQPKSWRKDEIKDALLVSEVFTGVNTGTYIVGRFGMHWADMDKPSVTDAADLEEYKKVVAPYVDKVTAAYYEFLPKWSNPSADVAPPKYIAVVAFHIQSAIARVHEANQKLKTPTHNAWYRLVNGGPGGTYVLTTDHANWASFEDDPAVKPLRDRLREAFGEQEAMSVIERLNGSIESTHSDLIQTRPYLSYIPAK